MAERSLTKWQPTIAQTVNLANPGIPHIKPLHFVLIITAHGIAENFPHKI
jgi:hypothetical protein